MSPRRVVQQSFDGFHGYLEPQPTRTGYRARCKCGWRSRRSLITKRSAQGLWRSHATTEVGRGI